LVADLLSAKEIKLVEQRWAIACAQIENPGTKKNARRQHGASQDLVDRVFAALDNPRSGYRLVQRRMHGYMRKPKG
jgi:uncharacterized protein YerC